MDRFEKFVKDGAFIERENGNVPYAEIIYRLKSYEDTNLLPKEIERLKLVEKLYQESSIGHIYEEFNRLQEENDKFKKLHKELKGGSDDL